MKDTTKGIPALIEQIIDTGEQLGNTPWRRVMLDLQQQRAPLLEYMRQMKREIRFPGVSRVLLVDIGRRISGSYVLRWRLLHGRDSKFITYETVRSDIFPLITVQDAQKCEVIQGFMTELNVMDSLISYQIKAIQNRILSPRKREKE